MAFSRWGGEGLANTVVIGAQSEPTVIARPDGGFTILWTDAALGATNTNVKGQHFDALGQKVGGEFTWNQTDPDAQSDPVGVYLSNGALALVNIDADGVGSSDLDVRRSLLSPYNVPSQNGVAIVGGANLLLDVEGEVAAFGSGYVAVWRVAATNNDVRIARFDAAGQQVTPTGATTNFFNLSSAVAGAQSSPDVAATASGLVGVWASNGTIVARRFTDVNASVGGEIVVAAASSGSGVTISYSDPHVVGTPDGGFAVSVTSNTSGYVSSRVYRFDAAGAPVGSVALGDVGVVGAIGSELVASRVNGFFAATVTVSAIGGDVTLAKFDSSGQRVGFLSGVSTTAVSGLSSGESVSVAELSDGRVVVAWYSAGPRDGDGGILYQIIDPRDGVVQGTQGADTLIGGDVDDEIAAFGGNDLVRGRAGADRIYTGDGADQIFGDGGDDLIFAGAGDDQITGGVGADSINGESGVDRFIVEFAFGAAGLFFGTRNEVSLDTPSGFDTLQGVETFLFTDRTIQRVDAQPYVDDLFYFAQRRDVFAAGIDPDDHYFGGGFSEGNDPNAFFSTRGYWSANPDVRAAGINPLAHYAAGGAAENRDPSANFDSRLYLLYNPDVAAAGVNPLLHWLVTGAAEGRQVFAAIGTTLRVNGFDAQYYLLRYPEIGLAGQDPWTHYSTVGWREGRDPNGWFDGAGYLAAYADVAAGSLNALDHYDQVGWRQNRDPSGKFDTSVYLAAYTDVAAANINPLWHFLLGGVYEGRRDWGDGDFDAAGSGALAAIGVDVDPGWTPGVQIAGELVV